MPRQNTLFLFLLTMISLWSQVSTLHADMQQMQRCTPYIVQTPQHSIAQKQQPKICLTMIVKNESRIIERCLNSVKDIVDCISICDTGSGDNTVAIIEKFMQDNNIPGKVHQHTWKNFGHNRTLSSHAAQKTLEELGFSLPNTYLLLIDADMMLKIEPNFTKDSLIADSYHLTQKNHWISYYNTRLTRASLPWTCVGVTHEYWSCNQAQSSGKLDTLMIDDREDGGCKDDKFTRDIALLTQGLENEPDNVRYMFYLAQSYKCIRQFDDSIYWYKKRIDKGGWKEEVWYAKFMIGECYEKMNLWEKALQWYLEAYEFNPDRAEPLQKITNYYVANSKSHLAYLFAKHGVRIPYPKDQVLFIAHPVYDYQFMEALSIASYYTPFKNEGMAAVNALVLKRDAPENIKRQAYSNALFYVENIKDIKYHPINIELPLIRDGKPARYQPKNASIQKTDDGGYVLACGAVNYLQKGAVVFNVLDDEDPTKTVRTRNFLVKLDKNFQILSQQEIIENVQRIHHPSIVNVKGLEDPRLFHHANNLWFICTTLDTNPEPPHIHQMSLCKLSGDTTNNLQSVDLLLPLIGPDLKRCEKNWLPFIRDNKLLLLYSYDPIIVYEPDLISGVCKKIVELKPKHDFSAFRGSASPIAFDGGYLMLVHEMVMKDERFYLHRFIWLDNNFVVQKVSLPFTFKHKGIEFCAGMTTDHAEKNILLTIGIEDRESYIGEIAMENVRAILQPLP